MILKCGRCTVIRYLKAGNKLNMCDYDPEKEKIKNTISKYKKVYCIELEKVFDSVIMAAEAVNINHSNISSCCKHKTKYAGRDPITNKPLHWVYYNEIKFGT